MMRNKKVSGNVSILCSPAAVSALLAALFLSACAGPSPTATRGAALVSGELNDGEIVRVMQVLNEGEIRQAELALRRSESDNLRQTAEVMVDERRQSNEQFSSLIDRGIEPEESPLSRTLEMQAGNTRNNLLDLSGAEFECAYLDAQINHHEVALETVRDELIPDATDQELAQLLVNIEPNLEEHLRSAREARNNHGGCL